jgi:hypothetical protein
VEQDRIRTQTIPEISGWRTRPNFLAKFFGEKFWSGLARCRAYARTAMKAGRSLWSVTVTTKRSDSMACQPIRGIRSIGIELLGVS